MSILSTRLIRKFKSQGGLIPGMVLSHLLSQRLKCTRREKLPDLIIPVPLHPSRLRQRGFNQAMEIAGVLSNQLKVPVNSKACRRVINTISQQGLTATDRIENMRGSFEVDPGLALRKVAIVDDVVTTGGTVSELTSELILSRGRNCPRLGVSPHLRAAVVPQPPRIGGSRIRYEIMAASQLESSDPVDWH